MLVLFLDPHPCGKNEPNLNLYTKLTVPNTTLCTYLLPRNECAYPIGLDLLDCYLDSFTPTNKIRMGSVYVVHLENRTR